MRSTSKQSLSAVARSRVLEALIVLLGLLALTPAPARACPDCEAGRRARTQVLGESFGSRLLAILSPFLVPAAIAAFVEAKRTKM